MNLSTNNPRSILKYLKNNHQMLKAKEYFLISEALIESRNFTLIKSLPKVVDLKQPALRHLDEIVFLNSL